MNLLRRIAYFGYYLRKMDWPLLGKFAAYVQEKRGVSKFRQFQYVVRDSLRFNISILEYYQFRFFECTDSGKASWAGTGTMYEFQRLANPKGAREVLSDKRSFYAGYKQFFRHELCAISELRSNRELIEQLLESNDKLVFKEATGNCGAGVLIKSTTEIDPEKMVDFMDKQGFDLVETFVNQHQDLDMLSPSAVNTVRIFTQMRRSGEYEVLGCRLRISVNSPVDNLAAGNLAAPIDEKTGVVSGPGVYSDMTRRSEAIHPVTGISIVGFQVPFWAETLRLVRDASFLYAANRSVGWDVVITEKGPGLIEGNHDWCKLVSQLPVQKGLKHLLDENI